MSAAIDHQLRAGAHWFGLLSAPEAEPFYAGLGFVAVDHAEHVGAPAGVTPAAAPQIQPPAPEQHEHDGDGDHLRHHASTKNGQPAGDARAPSSAKFMPKNPTIHVSGMKIVATIVSRFMTSFSRLETVER